MGSATLKRTSSIAHARRYAPLYNHVVEATRAERAECFARSVLNKLETWLILLIKERRHR